MYLLYVMIRHQQHMAENEVALLSGVVGPQIWALSVVWKWFETRDKETRVLHQSYSGGNVPAEVNLKFGIAEIAYIILRPFGPPLGECLVKPQL